MICIRTRRSASKVVFRPVVEIVEVVDDGAVIVLDWDYHDGRDNRLLDVIVTFPLLHPHQLLFDETS